MTAKKQNAYMHIRHGMSKTTRAYRTWSRMKSRCGNKNIPGYENYGGRGITYDPAWEEFAAFFADMGECPLGMSLERKDTNGNYCKANCKWATRIEQNNNQRIRVDNKSGLKGVKKERGYWRAQGSEDAVRVHLYKGKDFFEACCARKSWEVRNG